MTCDCDRTRPKLFIKEDYMLGLTVNFTLSGEVIQGDIIFIYLSERQNVIFGVKGDEDGQIFEVRALDCRIVG